MTDLPPGVCGDGFSVLAITPLFPTAYEPAGWPPEYGVFNKQQFVALAAHARVRVVAPGPWLPRLPMSRYWKRWHSFAAVPRHETIEGIEVSRPRYVMLPKIGRKWDAGAFVVGTRPTLRQRVQAERADCVLATWAYPDIVATVRLRSEFQAPIVAKLHGSDINQHAAAGWCRRVVADALRQCEAVVCVSADLGDRALALGVRPEKVHVIRNGVDAHRFTLQDRAQCRRRLGLSLDGRLIAFIGGLVPEKGPDVLMRAFTKLQSSVNGTSVRLVVVGDGRMRSEFARQMSGPMASGLVRFVGSRPHAEIATWLAAAAVRCGPSRQEGCPNVVLEALASGRPVVGSRTGGLPELIRHGANGLLVPAEDPDALTHALDHALQTEWNAEEIRRSTAASWEENAARLFEVLRYATGRA